MKRRTEPVTIQPAAGLENYHDFSKPEVLAEYRRSLAASNLEGGKLPENVNVDWISLGGVQSAKIYIADAAEGKLIFHIHGGAWNGGVPCTGQRAFIELQQDLGIDIISVDYGLAPEHPFPDGLNDCVKAYRAVLDIGYSPENIVFLGESAGGNLCLASCLCARDQGLPLPGGLALVSPSVCPVGIEEMKKRLAENPDDLKLSEDIMTHEMYDTKHDESNPYLYPIFGDYKGFPPVLVQFGGSEMLYQDGMAITKKLMEDGVDVLSHCWQFMPHVFVLLSGIIPEAEAGRKEIGNFMRYVLE